MKPAELEAQVLATWRRHQEILLVLLDEIPDEGLAAKPTGSRGRDVARVFTHRGQIALALKQSGMRLPEAVSVKVLWGRWIFGA